MKILPITARDISTPYSVSSEEPARVQVAANRTISVSRSIAHHMLMTLTLIPYRYLIYSRLDLQPEIEANRLPADKGRQLATFLNQNASFLVPVFNNRPNPFINSIIPITVAIEANISDYEVEVDVADGLFPGQYIRFENKAKLYQIASVNSLQLKITLVNPLRSKVPLGTKIITAETLYDGTVFNGVLGAFVNSDFGVSLQKVENGVLAEIGPLSLKENLMVDASYFPGTGVMLNTSTDNLNIAGQQGSIS